MVCGAQAGARGEWGVGRWGEGEGCVRERDDERLRFALGTGESDRGRGRGPHREGREKKRSAGGVANGC